MNYMYDPLSLQTVKNWLQMTYGHRDRDTVTVLFQGVSLSCDVIVTGLVKIVD